jgi:hypothetical protein
MSKCRKEIIKFKILGIIFMLSKCQCPESGFYRICIVKEKRHIFINFTTKQSFITWI